MRTVCLILGSVLFPLVWGWATHRVMGWLWPENQPLVATRDKIANSRDPLADYQI